MCVCLCAAVHVGRQQWHRELWGAWTGYRRGSAGHGLLPLTDNIVCVYGALGGFDGLSASVHGGSGTHGRRKCILRLQSRIHWQTLDAAQGWCFLSSCRYIIFHQSVSQSVSHCVCVCWSPFLESTHTHIYTYIYFHISQPSSYCVWMTKGFLCVISG